MNRSDTEFLSQLRRQAEENEEQFLDNIAKRLGRSRITEKPVHPFHGAPQFWREWTVNVPERIEQFLENWTNAGGKSSRCASLQEAGKTIIELAQAAHASRILLQQQPELAQLAEQSLKSELSEASISFWDEEEDGISAAAEADIGIIVADYAVSFTGSIVKLSASQKGRSTSLLPTKLIALVPVERLKARLGEVMEQLDELPQEQVPAGIHFISGPSRSADIENDLTIGVHGPGDVHVIIVG